MDVVVEGESLGSFLGLDLDAWAEQYHDQVMTYAKQQGLDGADTGVWQLIEYSKGLGLYARVFRTCIETAMVPPVLHVSSRSPLASTFLSVARASGKFTILTGVR